MIDDATFGNLRALYHTFGCKLNFAETSTVAEQLSRRGVCRVQPGETPDIVVVNTCSVTELADRKCRQAIRSLHRRYPQAAIVVTGCYAQLKPEDVADLEGVAVVAGADRKGEIDRLVDQWLQERHPLQTVIPSRQMLTFTPCCSRGDRTRFFLKVQDGCDCWCTYCTIPAARGRSRSATVSEIVAQAQQAAAQGAREIVLTGVNIGDFGRRNGTAPEGSPLLGKPTGETFFDLVKALDEQVEGVARFRISSIEPDLLTDEIIDFCAGSRAFMPHFHIPLQCGSDAVLKLMHRHYDTALFAHKIEHIRQTMPDAFIGVDVIAGARGETQEEFERSFAFIEGLDITRLHVFPYSERPGTKALEITHKVSEAEKHQRVNRLMHLSQQKMEAFTNRYLGTQRNVLLEHPGHGSYMSGFTDNYLRVHVMELSPAQREALDNQIVPVHLKQITPSRLEEPEIIGTLV